MHSPLEAGTAVAIGCPVIGRTRILGVALDRSKSGFLCGLAHELGDALAYGRSTANDQVFLVSAHLDLDPEAGLNAWATRHSVIAHPVMLSSRTRGPRERTGLAWPAVVVGPETRG